MHPCCSQNRPLRKVLFTKSPVQKTKVGIFDPLKLDGRADGNRRKAFPYIPAPILIHLPLLRALREFHNIFVHSVFQCSRLRLPIYAVSPIWECSILRQVKTFHQLDCTSFSEWKCNFPLLTTLSTQSDKNTSSVRHHQGTTFVASQTNPV